MTTGDSLASLSIHCWIIQVLLMTIYWIYITLAKTMLAILDPELCVLKISLFFPWGVVRVKLPAVKHLTHTKSRASIRWHSDRIFLCRGSCTWFWTLIISRLIFLLGAKGTFFSNSSSFCTEREKSLLLVLMDWGLQAGSGALCITATHQTPSGRFGQALNFTTQ